MKQTNKKILKSTRAVPVNTTRTLKDEEAEKKHKLTKDWPVICYPIFFFMLSFCCMAFYSSPDKFKFAGISPRGKLYFLGEFKMFLNFSQRRLNFLFTEIVFPPKGNCISPNQSGEIRFSLVGNLGKNNLFCSFFFKLELFRGKSSF